MNQQPNSEWVMSLTVAGARTSLLDNGQQNMLECVMRKWKHIYRMHINKAYARVNVNSGLWIKVLRHTTKVDWSNKFECDEIHVGELKWPPNHSKWRSILLTIFSRTLYNTIEIRVLKLDPTLLFHKLNCIITCPVYNHEHKGKRVHFETIKEATFKVKFSEKISFEQTYILK